MEYESILPDTKAHLFINLLEQRGEHSQFKPLCFPISRSWSFIHFSPYILLFFSVHASTCMCTCVVVVKMIASSYFLWEFGKDGKLLERKILALYLKHNDSYTYFYRFLGFWVLRNIVGVLWNEGQRPFNKKERAN